MAVKDHAMSISRKGHICNDTHWLHMTKESLEMLTSLLAIGYPLLGQEMDEELMPGNEVSLCFAHWWLEIKRHINIKRVHLDKIHKYDIRWQCKHQYATLTPDNCVGFRSCVYPGCRAIDDSAGFDFVIVDTAQRIVPSQGKRSVRLGRCQVAGFPTCTTFPFGICRWHLHEKSITHIMKNISKHQQII